MLTLAASLAAARLPAGEPADVVAAADLASCNSAYCSADTWLSGRVDYQLWWTTGSPLPPLVTTSPPDVDLLDAGVPGEPGTRILFGDDRTSTGPRSGMRVTAGVKLDDPGVWWLTTDWLFLESRADRYHAASTGAPILARPFYDQAVAGPNSELISYPGLLAGEVSVDASNSLWGAGAGVQANWLCCDWEESDAGSRVDLLLGYRYLELSDRVRIRERIETTAPLGPLLVGTLFDVTDAYHNRSQFHGVELGMRGEMARRGFFVAGEARVALGGVRHRLAVDGMTTVRVPGQSPVSYAGGLLATGAALGEYTDREFAVVPQAEIRVGRYLTDHLRVSVGYSLLYWSQVVRAGTHINTTIDSSALPAANSPPAAAGTIPLRSSSFWGQGLTATLEWEY